MLARLRTWSPSIRLSPYRVVLWLLILGYSWLFFSLAADIHLGMRTHKADLGQIDQAVWNSSRGRFLEQTDNGFAATRLTDHVEPILVLVSPIFWLWNDVRALLLLQVAFVALGAWLLYELSLHQFDKGLTPRERTQIWRLEPLRDLTQPVALALAIAFLLASQLQSAVLTEFHAAPLAVPLLLWAFLAVERQRWRQFVIATLMAALVKEEIALLAAGLGFWAMWRGWWEQRCERSRQQTENAEPDAPMPAQSATQPEGVPGHSPSANSFQALIAGSVVALLCLAWFATATFVIVPNHAVDVYGVAESGYFQRYGSLGNSPIDIFTGLITQPKVVWSILTEPARLDYLFGLAAPFGLLALLAPEVILLSLPVLLANLLSAYPAQYYGEFHYSAPLVPYFAVAAAYGLGRLWRWLARRTERSASNFQYMPAASTGTMAVVSFWTNAGNALRPLITWMLVVWILVWALFSYRQHGRGPLAARYDPTPISSHHETLERFVEQIPTGAAVTATAAVHPHVSHRRHVYQFPIGLEQRGRELGNANWALIDVTTNTDMAPGDVKSRVDKMLATGWGVVDAADGFLLLAKGAATTEIPNAFYDFARAPVQEPSTDTRGGVRLQGVEIEDWPRWRQSKVVGLWQAPEDSSQLDPDTVDLAIRAPNGEHISSLATVRPPALIWYPPERWAPDEVVRITSLPLYLPQAFGLTARSDTVAMDSMPLYGVDGQSWMQGFVRGRHDRGSIVWPSSASTREFGREMGMLIDATPERIDAQLRAGDETLSVAAWLPTRALRPDRALDLWLQWSGANRWPNGWTVFVHLRRDGANTAQNDGASRLVVPYDTEAQLSTAGVANDWRQFIVPATDLTPGEWTVAVGLYEPDSGERAQVYDPDGILIGHEIPLGVFVVAPRPVPDQTCALVPATCPAQFVD